MAGEWTGHTKWSNDEFLDQLRCLGDQAAEDCVRDLPPEQTLAYVFSRMRTDAELPTDLPAAFATFLRAARPSLEFADLTPEEHVRLRRGQDVFMRHALAGALTLLVKSLQEGYQAPRLSEVLMLSGELQSDTYRRLLGVLQMLLLIVTPGSFESKRPSELLPTSDAGLTAARVRLMHAGLRGIAKHHLPDFTARHGGVPISLEDLLATLMGFSSLVMDGFKTLRIKLSDEDAEAYHFVWKVYARSMGIHPPGEPRSWDFVPATLTEAREFYLAYARRHYAEAAENEAGLKLAKANLLMLNRRLPPLVARIYMHRLMGREACLRLGIRGVPLMYGLKLLLYNFPRAWEWLGTLLDRRQGGIEKHRELTQVMLQKLILLQYRESTATFRVPRELADIREVVEGTRPGLSYGSEQFAKQVFPAEIQDIAARRQALGLDTSQLAGPPGPERGLVGLALSGGGIRSATFALGAVQALARHHCLRVVDYLSTVAGGGYTGAAVSCLLNARGADVQGRAFPLDFRPGATEPPALRQLRSGSNFLGGGSLLNEARLPMILLRGFLLNALLLLPYIMLAALFTLLIDPYLDQSRALLAAFWITLALFLALVWSYPASMQLFGRNRSWERRNRTENLQTLSLLAFGATVLMSILAEPISHAITTDWTSIRAFVTQELSHPTEVGDLWKWALMALIALATLLAGRAARGSTKRTNRMFLYGLGLLGPAAVFGSYLLLLITFARSPLLPLQDAVALMQASHTRPVPLILDDGLQSRLHVRGVTDPNLRVDYHRDSDSWTLDGALQDYRVTRGTGSLWLHGVEFGTRPVDFWFLGITLALFVFNALFVDVNITSPHGFWRDRLSRVFLFRARWFGRARHVDRIKLSELGGENPAVPCHLVNACLNLAGSHVEDLPGRGADFFIFSRRFVGSYATGFCRTTEMEKSDSHLDLGTATAISAATTAPNAGANTIRPLVFVLTLLNVRLDYWLPNPWYVQGASLIRRLMARARPGPWYLFREATGQLHARGAYVNLSDGGHVEALGVYELLRRRCRLIIAIDSESDPHVSCAALARLIRHARIDLGIEMDINTSALRPDTSGLSQGHWTIGTIRYGDDETGHLLYVKASVTGDEAPYVTEYRSRHPDFPHEPMLDQFFDEAQFESYRSLGYHALSGALQSLTVLGPGDAGPEGAAALRAVQEALKLDPASRGAWPLPSA